MGNDAAHGDLKDLITDVGINENSIPFVNFAAEDNINGNMMYESDHQFKYLANAFFCPLDMTDHEEAFVGWNELPMDVPITNTSWLTPVMAEPFPQTDMLVEEDVYEKRPVTGTGPTMFAINDARAADVEEEEAPGEYGIEEEDEYGEDGYGEEGEEGEEAVWPPKQQVPSVEPSDRLFLGQEK